MSSSSSNLRGIAYMVLATLFFTSNDSLMKLATVGLPPFEVLCLRGVMATLWATPVVLLTGNGRHLSKLVDPWVLLRNSFEVIAVLCFVVALANMPIADITALNQLAPMLLLLGVALIYRDKIGWVRMVLIALGFLGALLVAQPSASGVSPYVLLGLGCATASAVRDIVGRKVSLSVPSIIVAYNTLIIVMLAAGAMMLLFEKPVMPDLTHLAYLAGSGFFLSLGHLFIFMSYRSGATAAVAPFYYLFAIWAVLLGIVVFGTFPNPLALVGIALILGSGLAVVLLDEKRRRTALELEPVA